MEFINKFKNYLLAQKNKPSLVTVKNYLADVKQFIAWFEEVYTHPFNPQKVTIQSINEFKAEKTQTLSASSVERHISSLRKFFTFLKLDGQISHSPFEQVPSAAEIAAKHDPWHLHEFKNYLYIYNASNLTIKNYLIDVKQFLQWAEEVTGVHDAWHIQDKNILAKIDNSLVEEYKTRLMRQGTFSASSINRKLSSLRKYLSWGAEQGYLNNELHIANYELGKETQRMDTQGAAGHRELAEGAERAVIGEKGLTELHDTRQATNSIQTQRNYSKIPPIRLLQKVIIAGNSALDVLIVNPITFLFRKVEHGKWVVQGKPLFKNASRFSPAIFTAQTARLHEQITRLRFKPMVKNISKGLYAPLSISTKDFPWYKKLFYHARYTRPQWYHKYHQLAIAHYFNWAVLIIFSAAIGFGMYNSFVKTPGRSLAALPTAGTRILSFQGRLTDASDNPITTPTWIRFEVYNDTSASGSARLWEEVDKVSPDQDGIFSLNLGSNGSGGQAPLCNSGNPPTSPATGACGIPQSLFAQNSALWLGVTVENTAELTPREQIATVAYAVNSETLQGLPPITQSGAGTSNVVLALNSSGNLAIGGSTTFQATSGSFSLSGNTLTLNTNSGTNGNITLAPDGQGYIDIQKPIQNSTLNNNLSSAAGAVEVDDLMAILATSSGQSALTINQNGSGPIISASHSGTAEFTLDSSGNGTFNGNVTGQTIYTGGGTSYYINNAISNLNSLTLAANLSVSGNISSNLTPSAGDTYSLGTSTSNEWLNLYVKNIYSGGVALTQIWQRLGGVVAPLNITDDLAIGGNATSSAKFQVFGLTGNATTSGNLTFAGTSATNVIATRNNTSLTIGDAQTGNIFLSPQAGSGLVSLSGNFLQTGSGTFTTGTGLTTIGGNLTVNGTTQTVGNGSNYTIQTTGNGALSLLSAGTGNIILGQNAGVGNITIQPNAGGQAALIVSKPTTTGDIFTASSSSSMKFTIKNDGTLVSGKYTTAGGVFYTDTNGTFTQVSNASANTVLHGGSTPTFSAVDLVNDTTGIVPLSKGGTGANLTGDQGGLLYFNSATSLAVVNHTATTGQCLVSGGTGAPTWATCSTGSSGTNYWQLSAGAIAPIYSTVDLLLGSGTPATSSAKFAVTGMIGSLTPAASVSATVASGGSGTGIVIKGDSSIQSLINSQLTIGGNTTGNIVLSPLNGSGAVTVNGNGLDTTSNTFNLLSTATTINIGAAGNTTTFKSSAIDSNQSSLALFATPASITFGGAATTLTIGKSSGTTTVLGTESVNGNVTLGTNATNTVTINGLVSGAGTNNALQPVGTGVTDLGSASHYWGTVYAQNFIAPVGGGTSGFWQLVNSVLSPVNFWNDLAVGGNATASATPFQVFASKYTNDQGTVPAGTATTSGNLIFRGTAGSQTAFKVDLLNGSSLTFNRSGGGDKGETAVLTIGNDGNLTDAGNLAVNGGTLSTSAATGTIFASATNINIGGASSTIGLKGNLTIGSSGSNLISVTGEFNTDLLPSASGGPYNIGGLNNRWGNIFATSLNLPVAGGTDGYWTLSSSVLSPTNNWNDLSLGGTATSSAKFQVFANAYTNDLGTVLAGTASTSGGLTFRGSTASTTNFQANLLYNSTFGFYNSVGGDKGITLSNPALYITNKGSIGIGTNNLLATVDVRGNLATSPVASISGQTSSPTLVIDNKGTGDYLDINNNGKNILAFIQNGSNGHNALIPGSTDSYDLGSNPSSGGKEWDTLYVRQIISPSGGGTAGYWQLTNGVLSPANITNDLAVGGTATSSAAFQVFAKAYTNDLGTVPAGTATTSGNLTFRGTPGSQTAFQTNILNGASLGFYNSVGGDKGISASTPTLYLSASGNVGIGTNNPGYKLNVSNGNIAITSGGYFYNATASNVVKALFNGGGDWLGIQSDASNVYSFADKTANSSTLGTPVLSLLLNGSGGSVGIGSTSPQGILDVASNATNLPSDLTLAQTSGTNLIPNPSLEGNSTTNWSLAQGGTGGTMATTTSTSMFGSYSLLVTTGTAWTEGAYTLTVTPNTTYTFSAWVKTSTANNAKLQIFDHGTSTGTSSSLHPGDGKWHRLTVTATTGASTTVVDVDLFNQGTNGSTAYYDGVQLEQSSSASPYIDGSLGPGYYWTGTPNNSTSVRQANAAFAYDTINSATGIGAASLSQFPTLQLDQNGTGDIIGASASGVTQFQVTNGGNVLSRKFTDLDNTSYFLDPAAAPGNISLAVAGNVGIGTTSPDTLLTVYQQGSTSPVVNTAEFGNESISFSSSSDTAVNGQLYFPGSGWQNGYISYYPHKSDGKSYFRIAGQSSNYGDSPTGLLVTGNVGIGTTSPISNLQLAAGGAGEGTLLADTIEPAQGMVDVAAGATVSVSGGNLDSGGPTYRGNSSIWQANATGQYLTVDLGSAIGIQYITFGTSWRTDTRYIPNGFTISYSNDNVTYTTLSSVTGNTNAEVYANANGVSARYWRLMINTFQSGYTYANIAGLQLFSSGYGSLSGEGSQLWGQNPAISDNVFLRSVGNVGIGTTGPGYKLEVNGNIGITSGSGGAIAWPSGGSNTYLSESWGVGYQGDTTHPFAVRNSGLIVGLTASGGSYGAGQIVQRAPSSTISPESINPSNLWLQNNALSYGVGAWVDTNTNGALVFSGYNGGSFTNDMLSLDRQDDRVGINTTTPGDTFYVNGTSTFHGQSGAGQLNLSSSGTSAHWNIGPDSTANNLVVYSSGGGGMYMLNANQFWSARSDQRLKTNIVPLSYSDPLGAIMKLNPVSFNWRNASQSGFTNLGFIAQQVQQVFPELVSTGSDTTITLADGSTETIHNPLGVEYDGLISPAIAAIQELASSVSAQQSRVATNSAILKNLSLTQTGDISITAATPSADFTIPTYYNITDAFGNPIKQMGALLELAVGNLRAGSIQAQQMLTNSLAIATANVTVAGQSLHDYILSVVQSAGFTSGSVAQSNSVKTNIISPLDNSNIAIRLNNSGIEIAKDASSSAVASIDNNGNATFSGTLNSQNLAINGDATVSGTLHANRIEANSIAGLSEVVSTLSAQNITNVTNIYFATPSAAPTPANTIIGSNSISSPSSSLTSTNNFTSIASFSAYFSYVPSLQSDTSTVTNGFTSSGSTNLGDTSITGQLTVGSQMIIADNALNVIGTDFAIQPLKQGGVTFEGGLVAIDTNGNLTVNGNATFNGNVAVNTLSPLPGHDLNVSLPNQSQLTIHNASGSAVFAVNQQGDVAAQGSANIGKLNFNLVQPALAVSDIEVVASGSAGTAAINAHQTELTVDNPNVTANSLIYITPVGTDQTPYLLRQVSGKSFTVGIPVPQLNAVNFNWLIVN